MRKDPLVHVSLTLKQAILLYDLKTKEYDISFNFYLCAANLTHHLLIQNYLEVQTLTSGCKPITYILQSFIS